MINSNDVSNSRHDLTARWMAGISLVLNLVLGCIGVFYSWAQSPYYFAQPDKISYWTDQKNLLSEDMKPISGSLVVYIHNGARTPARDIRIVITPISEKPVVKCSSKYEMQEGTGGTYIVCVEQIAANSTIELSVYEEVSSYPPNENIFLGDFKYSAGVNDVQNEFGTIRKNHEKCIEKLKRVPNDQGGLRV